jgi:hypothetical protein
VIAGGLHDRAAAAAVDDRRSRRLPQPHGQPGAGRDLGDLFSERLARTGWCRAVPAAFTPAQLHRPPADRQVPRSGRRPLLHPDCPLPALRTASCLFTTGGQIHHRDTGGVQLDPLSDQALKAQQPGRIVDHARSSSPVTIRSRHSDDH